MWVAVTAGVTVFVVRLSRGAKVAQELLGERFCGILVTDRWRAYTWYPTRWRQVCWAHLLRDFEAMIARGGHSQEIGAALRQQVAVFHCYYNFCLSHASLRQPLPQPEFTNGTGSATQWRPCTPAMAAGLTDYVWSLKEVVLCRVPPWPQPQGR